MRTVIVEDVGTAEAKKQRLATTAVDAALEILRTEASGLVIEAAAPLVFRDSAGATTSASSLRRPR